MNQSSDSGKARVSLSVFGPGILFAASAVGLSHLVQSTRAGAEFGLGMLVIVLLACLMKYPMLRFGGEYATRTGQNLIEEYARQGRWAFIAYLLTELSGMIIVTAAVAIFTFGLVATSLGLDGDQQFGVYAVILAAVGILISGRYLLFENVAKVMVLIFALLTTGATLLVLPDIEWSISSTDFSNFDGRSVVFIIALIGATPTIATGAVWQSLWTEARQEEKGERDSIRSHLLDFNVGYWGATVLALFFVLLGTALLHGRDVDIETSGAGFAAQLLSLFTQVYGQWAFPFVAVIAITVLFSTLLTVIDGWTRVIVQVLEQYLRLSGGSVSHRKHYRRVLLIFCGVVFLAIGTLSGSFTDLLDFTTTVLFIISPVIAFLNHRAMFSGVISTEERPSKALWLWSVVAGFALSATTATYLYLRFLAT